MVLLLHINGIWANIEGLKTVNFLLSETFLIKKTKQTVKLQRSKMVTKNKKKLNQCPEISGCQ